MPSGLPDFENMIAYPAISKMALEANGVQNMWKSLIAIVTYFCSRYNLKHNMNNEQIKLCAKALLDDCGNYRLEDYFTMFEMAAKNAFVKIYDRIDQQIIFSIKEAYDDLRYREGQKILWQKEKERAELVEQARIEKLNSTTAIDVDFSKLLSVIQDAKDKSYTEGLERKKERLKQAKESFIKSIPKNFTVPPAIPKTEPDQNDIDFIEKCFTPKKKTHARKNNSDDRRR